MDVAFGWSRASRARFKAASSIGECTHDVAQASSLSSISFGVDGDHHRLLIEDERHVRRVAAPLRALVAVS